MNRLQKKCFIASTGLHLLLVLILLVGPAFLSSSSKPEDVMEIQFIPLKTTDDKVAGGGDPNGGTPPPQVQQAVQPPQITQPPVEPQVEPKPEKTVKPEPKPQVEDKPRNSDPESFEVSKTKQHKIEVNTHPVIRNTAQEKAKAQAASQARAAREAAAQQQRIASAVNGALSSLSGSFSGSTSIKLKGPGGGGIPYGNWLAGVRARYDDAWVVPDGVNNSSAVVTVTVTIARDGSVLSSSIIQLSGDPVADQSVRAVLNRVRDVPPLPDTATEDKRTVTINFSVKAKQGLG